MSQSVPTIGRRGSEQPAAQVVQTYHTISTEILPRVIPTVVDTAQILRGRNVYWLTAFFRTIVNSHPAQKR